MTRQSRLTVQGALTPDREPRHPLALLEEAAFRPAGDGRRCALVVEAPLFGSVPRGFPHYLVEAPRHTALPMGFGLALARTDLRVVVLTTPDEAAQPRVSWKRLAERAGLAILVMNKEPDVDETAREVPRLAEAWEIIRSAGLGFAVRVARRDFTSAARALASAWEHDGVRVVVFE